MTILAELARRAVAHPRTATFVKRAVAVQYGEGEKIEVPTWGIVVVYMTIFFFGVAVSLMSYMLNEVVATLCMVESPVAAITVSPSAHEASGKDGEKEGLLETGPTITLVHQKPITSTIRGTLRHLVANAGRFARFRGFRIHVLYSVLVSIVATFFKAALPDVPGQAILGASITSAVLANIHAAWTHRVVGMPTKRSIYQTIPAKSHWKTLALPAAITAVMPYISMYLTLGVGMLLGLHKLEEENITTCAQWMSLIARFATIGIFALTCSIFLCLPAMVTLVRIEASILPEDQDTIVPFDRTFGGKVVSQLMGGTGVVGFLDAWRSFNWEARRRLIKLFAKSFFIITALVVVFAHVVAFEVFAIMGPAIGKFMAQWKHDQDMMNGA